MKPLVLGLICAVLFSGAVRAQDWGSLDALLFAHLTHSGRAEAAYWLPDHNAPAQARQALGVVYEHIPGSAGNTSISVGFFQKGADGSWRFAGHIAELFGHDPRQAVFGPGHVDVTTTMLGPDDPRCCPTVATRWRVDLAQMRAFQIQ